MQQEAISEETATGSTQRDTTCWSDETEYENIRLRGLDPRWPERIEIALPSLCAFVSTIEVGVSSRGASDEQARRSRRGPDARRTGRAAKEAIGYMLHVCLVSTNGFGVEKC